MTKTDPFKHYHSSPEIIRLAVIMYVRFPFSLRNVEDLLHKHGIDISHETLRYWWNRFGPMFADEIRRKRVEPMRAYSNWQRHMDEVFLKVIVSGTTSDAWLVTVAGHESEVLRSYGAAMKEVGNADKRETGRWLNSRAEKSQASGWRLALLRPH